MVANPTASGRTHGDHPGSRSGLSEGPPISRLTSWSTCLLPIGHYSTIGHIVTTPGPVRVADTASDLACLWSTRYAIYMNTASLAYRNMPQS
jgi:hypothetical protein